MKTRKRIAFVLMMAVFTLLAGMSASAKTRGRVVGAAINVEREYYLYGGEASGIADVKSSNQKVAAVVTEQDGTRVDVYLKLKKTGTTNVSYKIIKDGKSQTCKIRLCVYKYKNPFKTLKVGKANYKSQFKGGSDYSTLMEGRGKVQIAVRKGWKVKSVKVQSAGSGWKKLKKNAKVDIAKKNSLRITLKNKKYGFTKDFWIWGGGF